MVMIFLLSVLSVAQFSLSDALSNKDSAIDRLNKQVGDLANLLSVEKSASQYLLRDIERLDLQLQATRSERDRLGANLDSARQSADALKIERDGLSERLTSLLAENNRLSLALTGNPYVPKVLGWVDGSWSDPAGAPTGAALGTRWLTEDFCDGTLIVVASHRVQVTNLLTHRRLIVSAGHKYFAHAP